MRNDALISVDERKAASLDVLFLRQRQQHVEKALIGLEHFDELHETTVRYIELAIKAVGTWIRLGPIVPNGRQVDAADELRNVLGFGVGRDERANAHAFFFRVKNTLDRYTINVALVLFAQMQRTQWAQLALDMNTRFCLKILAQGMGHEI